MSPRDVPAELVEKAAEFGFNLMAEGGRDIGRWADLPIDDISRDYHRVLARYHLSVVLTDDMIRPELRPWRPNLGFWLRHPLVSWGWHRQAKGGIE